MGSSDANQEGWWGTPTLKAYCETLLKKVSNFPFFLVLFLYFGKEDVSVVLRLPRRGSGDQRGADSAAVAGEADAHQSDWIVLWRGGGEARKGGHVPECVWVCRGAKAGHSWFTPAVVLEHTEHD